MLEALDALGVKVTADPSDPTLVTVEGCAGRFPVEVGPEGKMGCGPQETFRGCADICIGPRY